jgi:hypothetical protein
LDIIELSEDAIAHFAGNMLEVRSAEGECLIVMSRSAHEALTPSQIQQLEHHGRILSAPLETIETCGGGSARCMLAELHLPVI